MTVIAKKYALMSLDKTNMIPPAQNISTSQLLVPK